MQSASARHKVFSAAFALLAFFSLSTFFLVNYRLNIDVSPNTTQLQAILPESNAHQLRAIQELDVDRGGYDLRAASEAMSAEESNKSNDEEEGKQTEEEESVDVFPTEEPTAAVKSYDKGIILCLHEGIVDMGLSLIRELRCLGNDEIVQIYHCNGELSQSAQDLLTRKDPFVEIVDVCKHYADLGVFNEKLVETFKSYWIKPLALYHTNITEVLLLDADVVAMRDPAVLRTTPGYQETGTMFFYDRVVNKKTNFNKPVKLNPKSTKIYQYLKLWIDKFPYDRFALPGPRPSSHMAASFAYNGTTCHEQDSSMVAVDKSRSAKAMEILWYMITEKRFLFHFSWGDKEVFWLSWEFSHSKYTFSPWGIAAVEAAHNQDFDKHNDTLCGNMAHYLPVDDDEPELLYVNGRSMLQPYSEKKQFSNVFNYNPMYVSPRQRRRAVSAVNGTRRAQQECLVGMGAVSLPPVFHQRLMRRRIHAFALDTGNLEWLDRCEDDMLATAE